MRRMPHVIAGVPMRVINWVWRAVRRDDAMVEALRTGRPYVDADDPLVPFLAAWADEVRSGVPTARA